MSTSGWQLHQADAVDWLRTLAPDSVDLVITDPPYESLEKHRAVGTTTRLKHSKASSNDWFRIFPNDRFPDLFAQIFRVLKPDRHFYLFCDPETAFIAKPMAEQAGFKFWKPLVWDKQRIGMGYHYRARYEFVLFFEKRKQGKAEAGRPGRARRDQRPPGAQGLPGREATVRAGAAGPAERLPRRTGDRSVHGLGVDRAGGGEPGLSVRGQRHRRRLAGSDPAPSGQPAPVHRDRVGPRNRRFLDLHAPRLGATAQSQARIGRSDDPCAGVAGGWGC